MASFYKRVLDCRTLNANDAMQILESLDLGAYREIEIIVTVVRAGTGSPTLLLKHAAVNEPDAFIAFNTAISVDLTQGSGTIIHYHNAYFSRWVRWVTSGTFTTNPVVTVDIIAKE